MSAPTTWDREVQLLALSCISHLLQAPCALLKLKKMSHSGLRSISCLSVLGGSQLGQCQRGCCQLSAPQTLRGLCRPCLPSRLPLTLTLILTPYLCSSCCYKHTPLVFQLCLCFLISFSCSSCCRIASSTANTYKWQQLCTCLSTSTRYLILTAGN